MAYLRHNTHQVKIGSVLIGGNAPIIVQSMTNTDTSDIEKTTDQIIELANAGSEIIRLTVNNDDAAKAIPYIKEKLIKQNCSVPLVGDFHYNGHTLLSNHPDCASALDKYRINPGNVGFGKKKDQQFETIIKLAIKYNKPIRIGVNWGSLDQSLATVLMDKNKNSKNPKEANIVLREALVLSCLESAKRAEETGLGKNKIILSCKVSNVQDLVAIYQKLAKKSKYPLHLGLTEAGIGSKAIVASTAALAVLLQQGIGDTIRVSLTPFPQEPRTKEVSICQEILQTMGIRSFKPLVTSCPGCGRTSSDYFQHLAKEIQDFISKEFPIWKKRYPKAKNLNIAVMGCIVNGPGESKHADIGISLPGSGESPSAPVFIKGKKTHTLKGKNISKDFINIIKKHIISNC